MKKVSPKFCLFVSLASDSLQFQKQLVTKSETCFGFKPLGNHSCIKRKINSNNQKFQKEKRVVSHSLSYVHNQRHRQLDYHWKDCLKHLLFKINSNNTRKTCEICSKLTIKTPEQCQWHPSGVFIVNFEYTSHLFLVFPLLTLNK